MLASSTPLTRESLDRPVRTAYFLRVPNVGDRINPHLVEAVSGRRVKHVLTQEGPHVLGLGSVMGWATELSQVWGSGVMHPDPDLGVGAARKSNLHALRGKLTHVELRRAGLDVGDVPLGDPGFLAPRLLGIERDSDPDERIGLACHYTDRYHPVLRRMMAEDGVCDLDVLGLPRDFLRQMAGCKAVISTSLHGLVFAEALGIPNLWLTAGCGISGGEFTFHDWFSTTREPQRDPHALCAEDTAEGLAGRARLHESEIDRDALRDAFPGDLLEELEWWPSARVVPADACRKRPIPVFLISFDRGAQLRKTVNGVRQLDTATEIVIHDNGSTDPDALRTRDELECEGVQVFRESPIASPEELDGVNDSVERFFAEWGEPSRYVVSDCDIDMSVSDPRALDLYDHMLNRFVQLECVGPMLRIRDVPRDYPLYNRAMNRHVEQFWRHKPTIVETSFGPVAVLATGIDTTFALHRAGDPFRRLKNGFRVYEPFEALHLDWYQLDGDPYTDSSSSEISHWNNRGEHGRWQHEPLKYSWFNSVRLDASGAPEIYTERLE